MFCMKYEVQLRRLNGGVECRAFRRLECEACPEIPHSLECGRAPKRLTGYGQELRNQEFSERWARGADFARAMALIHFLVMPSCCVHLRTFPLLFTHSSRYFLCDD
jgi:hypothetical protein